jgi:hypothetical protein
MEAIEKAAFISIGRACGFAGLGVFSMLCGLLFDPVLAARAGGLISLSVAATLSIHAHFARTRPYKRTEVLLILRKEDQPPENIAQRVIVEVLRAKYLRIVRQTAVVSLTFLTVLVVLQLIL